MVVVSSAHDAAVASQRHRVILTASIATKSSSMPSGGAWPWTLFPQHAMLLSRRSAIECKSPAAIATKSPSTPAGGAWPSPLLTQRVHETRRDHDEVSLDAVRRCLTLVIVVSPTSDTSVVTSLHGVTSIRRCC